jgi:hypothetical protein
VDAMLRDVFRAKPSRRKRRIAVAQGLHQRLLA